MPSTYSTRLRLELQATGENAITWGTKANSVFQRLEDAIAGIANVSLGTSVSAAYTLSVANGVSDEARMGILRITGQLASSVPINLPAIEKSYWLYNGTTGAALRIGHAGGLAVSVTTGWSKLATDGSALWLLSEPFTPTIYLTDGSAATKYAQLSATQSITGTTHFTSTANFAAPVSASVLNVTQKVSTSSLNVAAIASISTLVATSVSVGNIGGTNAIFTSVSASAVYAQAMYVGGSVVLTSGTLPATAGAVSVSSVLVSNTGGYTNVVTSGTVANGVITVNAHTIRVRTSTGAALAALLADVSLVIIDQGDHVEIQLIKYPIDSGGS